jgi:copper chaperone NosL
MTLYRWPALLGLLLVLGACRDTNDAVDPVWGKHACQHCKMVVSDARSAAQLLTPEGDRFFFDDVGCMTEYLSAGRAQPKHAWVRDQAGSWVDTRTAKFVPGASTPMDYGFVADSSGTLDFAAVRQRVAAQREARRP